VSPAAAVGALMVRLLDERHPFAGLRDSLPAFWNVVLASAALRARARELVDDAQALLARLIAADEGVTPDDPDVQLAAALITATLRTCVLTTGRRMMAGEKADDIYPDVRAFVGRAFARLG